MSILRDSQWAQLDSIDLDGTRAIIKFATDHNAAHRVLPLVEHLINVKGISAVDMAKDVMNEEVPLISLLLSHRLWRSPTSREGAHIRMTSGEDTLNALFGCANFVGEAVVWILQDRLQEVVADTSPSLIIDLLWKIARSVRSLELSLLIIRVLSELKLSASDIPEASPPSFAIRLAVAVCTEYASQVQDICRSNSFGVPRSASAKLLINPTLRGQWTLGVEYRIDADLSIRQGDHIRLRDASSLSKSQPDVLDCIVRGSSRGSAILECLQVPVPHISDRSWAVHPCQPTATCQAEIDAILAFTDGAQDSTALHHIIVGSQPPSDSALQVLPSPERVPTLNDRSNPSLVSNTELLTRLLIYTASKPHSRQLVTTD